MTLLRHLLSVLLLPFMMAVVVPQWILSAWAGRDSRWMPDSMLESTTRVAGGLLVVAGLALFAWCVILFGRVGRGTLAPWDPTQRLVVVGPYRHVRNPMIASVASILAGEACYVGSWRLAVWLAAFATINHLYFVLAEEPGLARRFGADYERYRAGVPRWIPRLDPWKGDEHPVTAATSSADLR